VTFSTGKSTARTGTLSAALPHIRKMATRAAGLLTALAAVAAGGPPISPYAPVFDAAAVPPTPPTGWPSAVPHWPRYDSRVITVLNGTWSFGFADAGTLDPAAVPYAAITTPNTTTVPGSFDVAPMGISGPIGTAFFRAVHACTPGAVALLKFGAVNHYARVFVDGAVVGNHTAGPYTPFELLAGACGAHGTRELLVVANNERNATLSPTYTGGDFYFYSGIIRPVIVTELPASPYWIASVGPLTVDYTRGLIDIRVAVGGDPSTPSVHLAFAFNGGALGNASEYAVVGGVAVIPSIAVPGFALWTPGADNTRALFTLTVQDRASQDTVTVRSAVRQVGIDAASARITINGASPKLLGFM
jgi:beta-glucuronidase